LTLHDEGLDQFGFECLVLVIAMGDFTNTDYLGALKLGGQRANARSPKTKRSGNQERRP
jgi:hypothetical protein